MFRELIEGLKFLPVKGAQEVRDWRVNRRAADCLRQEFFVSECQTLPRPQSPL
ncbi:MAG: hypothetical protein AB7U82_05610 [Blastocatellales bacterium]